MDVYEAARSRLSLSKSPLKPTRQVYEPHTLSAWNTPSPFSSHHRCRPLESNGPRACSRTGSACCYLIKIWS